MTQELENLFEVNGRVIQRDSIQAVHLGSLMRLMVVGYDQKNRESTWITLGVNRIPLKFRIDTTLLTDKVAGSGKHYLAFNGGELFMGNGDLGALTTEQRRKYENWNVEVEKSEFGGNFI